ncbi:MAG: NADH-quinone oxidoreductase subunit C [Bacteroidetes bacterium]|nr:MAG: NADH-quinone oxidoreductase subunit C [Bacteroidota bacterium]
MNPELVLEKLKAQFGESIIKQEEGSDMLTLEVAREKIKEIISWLKNDPELQVSFLTLLGGVHYPKDEGRELAVVYHLHSLIHNFRMRLKVFMSIGQPEVPTITDVYVGANWQERETFDFYGIRFKGHPNLTRILNEDSMDYHPLRKEYHLEDGTREDKDDRFFGR